MYGCFGEHIDFVIRFPRKNSRNYRKAYFNKRRLKKYETPTGY